MLAFSPLFSYICPIAPNFDPAKNAVNRTFEAESGSRAGALAVEMECSAVFSVAALGILNTMLMSVFERTRELGVVRALGLKPRQLIALVLWETLALASVSAVLGLALGLLMDLGLVRYGIDLRMFTSSESWSFSGVALEPVMYGLVRPAGIVATIIGLYVISLLAALWPAIQAARIQPVVAMRQE